MNSGCAPARVGIIGHPDVTSDMLLQNEDVPSSRGNHARCRRRSREAQPVGGEVQSGHDMAKHAYGCTTTAERTRATGRPAADDLTRSATRIRYFDMR